MGDILKGVPFVFWSGPTSGSGPTSDPRWDQKYSNEINVGPTGPTWSANFLSLYMDSGHHIRHAMPRRDRCAQTQFREDEVEDGGLPATGIAKEPRHLLVLRVIPKPVDDTPHPGKLLRRQLYVCHDTGLSRCCQVRPLAIE